jgi:hypothetical protein
MERRKANMENWKTIFESHGWTFDHTGARRKVEARNGNPVWVVAGTDVVVVYENVPEEELYTDLHDKELGSFIMDGTEENSEAFTYFIHDRLSWADSVSVIEDLDQIWCIGLI